MTATVFAGISELVTGDELLEGADHSEHLGRLRDAAVVVQNGFVEWVGPAAQAPPADEHQDVGGRAVIPGFVDSHSHLVFAGDRSQEFAARMSGIRYDGGGIVTSVDATRAASDDELRALVGARVAEMRAQGTTTVEIKSGYGLNVQDEARSLRIAAEFTSETTFLGAHVVPPDFSDRRSEYVDLIIGEMLSACAPHARWIDVFCEPHSVHAFTEDEAHTRTMAELVGVHPKAETGVPTCGQHNPRLVLCEGVDAVRLTEHVDPARMRSAGREHLTDD